MHGFGLDPCHDTGSCFTRGNEMELHPYDVDARMIFPLIFIRLDEILSSKYYGANIISFSIFYEASIIILWGMYYGL